MWIAVSLLIIVVTLIWYSMKPFYWSKHNIPYLIPLPLIGNSINFLKYGAIDFMKKLHSQFPGRPYFGMHMFNQPTLYVKDPELIQKIFATDFEHFTSHGYYINADRDPPAANVFFLYGQEWKELRGKLSNCFTPSKVRAMLEGAPITISKLIDKIDSEHEKGNAINLDILLFYTEIDIVTQALFSIQSDTFDNIESMFTRITKSTFSWEYGSKILVSQVSRKLYNLLGLTAFRPEANKFLTEIVKVLVQQREEKNIIRQDFLQRMMELLNTKSSCEDEYFADKTRVPKYNLDTITAQCVVSYLASVETSSVTTTFLFHELALNPDIQERCRAEIKSAVDNNPVTLNDLPKLVYLSAAIDETLRKYPPLIATSRQCTKEYKSADDGFTITEGTRILMSALAMQLDEKYFPEPQVFRPERFLGEGLNEIKSGTYFPFGLGPKSCIGMNFALKGIKLTVSRLLQHYEFRLSSKTDIPLKFSKYAFLVTPANGAWFDVKPLHKQKL